MYHRNHHLIKLRLIDSAIVHVVVTKLILVSNVGLSKKIKQYLTGKRFVCHYFKLFVIFKNVLTVFSSTIKNQH